LQRAITAEKTGKKKRFFAWRRERKGVIVFPPRRKAGLAKSDPRVKRKKKKKKRALHLLSKLRLKRRRASGKQTNVTNLLPGS